MYAISMLSVCETASGGVGRYQENLTALFGQGIHSRVLLPEADKHIVSDALEKTTFQRKRRGAMAMINLVLAVLAERRCRRPDIYLFNSTFSLLPLLVLRVLRDNTPAVYCAHCWAVDTQQGSRWKAGLIKAVEGNLCGLADLVVNVSRSDAATAERHGYRGNQIVVQSAVPRANPQARSDVFNRQAPQDVHLLFVGRFDHQKGLDVLLPAFSRARRANARLHLHLVGGPVRGGEIPALPEGVTNHGWIASDKIDSYYKSADALIVPSRWEGLPLVVLEALRNATPVFVSTGCGMGNFAETAQCGQNFALTEEDLSHLLRGLQRKDLSDMRPRAFEAFETHFTLDRFGTEMAGHLRALVGGPQNG